MSNEDNDVAVGMERLGDAIHDLKQQKSLDHRELVCIETRAVFATFEDESHWQGKEDAEDKRKLIELFTEAERLMADVKDSLYKAVKKRLDDLHRRDFSKAEHESAFSG